MYTRLPCSNTACLIYLFIVSVILLIQIMIPLPFVVTVDGTMGRNGSVFLQCLPADSLARVRVRSSLGSESAICSDCLPSSRQLTCLRGSCVQWCSETGTLMFY